MKDFGRGVCHVVSLVDADGALVEYVFGGDLNIGGDDRDELMPIPGDDEPE